METNGEKRHRRYTTEPITVLIASVKEREEQLKIVLNRLLHQTKWQWINCHVVLNWYDEVPVWIKNLGCQVKSHINQTNKHAHDSIWQFMPNDGYVFVCDDDLLYPSNFFYKLIEAIERHRRRWVCTAHGSNITLPAADYMDARHTYGFSDRLERDIFNDVAGVGCCAFHVSTLQPTLQDFPIPFMRDLYFSLLCKKNDVKIVNVQRPSQWILPLATSGSTVYDETLNNKQLRSLKNRVMKEQLLPALHCANNVGSASDQGQYVLITDYGFDSRLISKTLETLDEVTDEQTNIIVFSDELKDYSFQSQGVEAIYDNTKRSVLTQYVTPDERKIGRMGSKVLTQYRFILGLPNGSRVISADGDLYFLRDPFQAFDFIVNGFDLSENGKLEMREAKSSQQIDVLAKDKFDIGVTTRCEEYQYPINGGVVMFRVNDQVKDFLRFLIEQLYNLTDPDLISYQKQFGHEGTDWYIDQDMWNVAYLSDDKLKEHYNVKITDVGCSFNYAPHADGEQTESGKAKLMGAFLDESVHVLHLKSRLKELLFEGLLP